MRSIDTVSALPMSQLSRMLGIINSTPGSAKSASGSMKGSPTSRTAISSSRTPVRQKLVGEKLGMSDTSVAVGVPSSVPTGVKIPLSSRRHGAKSMEYVDEIAESAGVKPPPNRTEFPVANTRAKSKAKDDAEKKTVVTKKDVAASFVDDARDHALKTLAEESTQKGGAKRFLRSPAQAEVLSPKIGARASASVSCASASQAVAADVATANVRARVTPASLGPPPKTHSSFFEERSLQYSRTADDGDVTDLPKKRRRVDAVCFDMSSDDDDSSAQDSDDGNGDSADEPGDDDDDDSHNGFPDFSVSQTDFPLRGLTTADLNSLSVLTTRELTARCSRKCRAPTPFERQIARAAVRVLPFPTHQPVALFQGRQTRVWGDEENAWLMQMVDAAIASPKVTTPGVRPQLSWKSIHKVYRKEFPGVARQYGVTKEQLQYRYRFLADCLKENRVNYGTGVVSGRKQGLAYLFA
jgi:hypothetical protein